MEEEKLDEKEIWPILDDLLSYLYDLSHLGFSHGDLQPWYIKFTKNLAVKIQNPLLYTTYWNAYNYRLANDTYRSPFSPETLKKYEHRE